MNELTPEVKAALEKTLKLGTVKQIEVEEGKHVAMPFAEYESLLTIRDAFAALHPPEPPELGAGDYCGCWKYPGDDHPYDVILTIYQQPNDLLGTVIRPDGTGVSFDRIPSELTNIRRIDDGEAWRKWATKPRGCGANMVGLLREHGMKTAADELEELLGRET